jgi:hypothetical protein
VPGRVCSTVVGEACVLKPGVADGPVLAVSSDDVNVSSSLKALVTAANSKNTNSPNRSECMFAEREDGNCMIGIKMSMVDSDNAEKTCFRTTIGMNSKQQTADCEVR